MWFVNLENVSFHKAPEEESYMTDRKKIRKWPEVEGIRLPRQQGRVPCEGLNTYSQSVKSIVELSPFYGSFLLPIVEFFSAWFCLDRDGNTRLKSNEASFGYAEKGRDRQSAACGWLFTRMDGLSLIDFRLAGGRETYAAALR